MRRINKEAVMKKYRTTFITLIMLLASTQLIFADAAPIPDPPAKRFLGWIAGGAAAVVAFVITKFRKKKGASSPDEEGEKAKTKAKPKKLNDGGSSKSGKF
jgi:hypothetical protein